MYKVIHVTTIMRKKKKSLHAEAARGQLVLVLNEGGEDRRVGLIIAPPKSVKRDWD